MMRTTISTKHTILYAEDDPDDQQLVKEALQVYEQHVQVITVSNGAMALNFLKSLPHEAPTPCLIILDIHMPVMGGKQTLIELRQLERFSSVPVLLFSTSSLPQDAHFARCYGAGFMTKPLDGRRLELIADQFIEHCTDEIKRSLQSKLL